MALAGKYLVKGSVMGVPLDCDVDFHVEGTELTGTFFVQGEYHDVLNGVANGDSFTCSTKLPTPMGKQRVKMEGEVVDDELTMRIRSVLGVITFKGDRVAE